MDRDLALALVAAMEAIKTAVQTIATNTTPAEPTPDSPAEEVGT